MGDAGEPEHPKESNYALLHHHLSKTDQKTTLVVMGDNIYPSGLPKAEDENRRAEEKKIKRLLSISNCFNGKTFVIAGNHDWDEMGPKGWEKVLAQQKYVNSFFGDDDAFQPQNAIPGPVFKEVHPKLLMIFMDLQWFFHGYGKPNKEMGEKTMLKNCVIKLKDKLLSRRDATVLFIAHHPLISYGDHGKTLHFIDKLFPLKWRDSRLWLPALGIGNIFPFGSRYIGDVQDLTHPRYDYIRKKLMEVLSIHPRVVQLAGHDHSLQHIRKGKLNIVVSGSGSKTSEVRNGEYLKFGISEKGFTRIEVNKSGEVNLQFWCVDDSKEKGNCVYSTDLEF